LFSMGESAPLDSPTSNHIQGLSGMTPWRPGRREGIPFAHHLGGLADRGAQQLLVRASLAVWSPATSGVPPVS